MIALAVLAAHFAGDYLFQSRRMAALKLTDAWVRFQHVAVYTICFYPVACFAEEAWRGVVFIVGVFVTHFLIDSRRFPSTVADWFEWRFLMNSDERQTAVKAASTEMVGNVAWVKVQRGEEERLPPNPWPPMAILNDQALHIITLAFLAALL